MNAKTTSPLIDDALAALGYPTLLETASVIRGTLRGASAPLASQLDDRTEYYSPAALRPRFESFGSHAPPHVLFLRAAGEVKPNARNIMHAFCTMRGRPAAVPGGVIDRTVIVITEQTRYTFVCGDLPAHYVSADSIGLANVLGSVLGEIKRCVKRGTVATRKSTGVGR